MEILRERNVATTIYFPLIVAGDTAFATSGEFTPANADSEHSVDGAAFGVLAGTVTYEGQGWWSLAVAQGECDGKITMISIIATEIEDQAIIIQTYGDDSAGILLNTFADYIIRRSLQSAEDSTKGDAKAFRSLLGAIAKQVNLIDASDGNNLITKETDDVTTLGTQAITGDAGAVPITKLDTT